VLTKRGAGNALAEDFARYVQQPPARAILARYGFSLPDGAVTEPRP
jgi:molybdate transport system substrate-binding protein